jgi:hypothetical protein
MKISPKIETWSGNNAIGEASITNIMPTPKMKIVTATIQNIARRKLAFADTTLFVRGMVVVMCHSPILRLDLSITLCLNFTLERLITKG